MQLIAHTFPRAPQHSSPYGTAAALGRTKLAQSSSTSHHAPHCSRWWAIAVYRLSFFVVRCRVLGWDGVGWDGVDGTNRLPRCLDSYGRRSASSSARRHA